jgi:hypothetical protein
MKVVCIDDHTLSSGRKIKGLTTGKIYDVKDGVRESYRIVDDNGEPNWYNYDVLIPLDKYRELKLNELGI